MADSTNDVCLERFINVMADLITKYADKIDLDSLPDVQMPEAEITEISAFFILWKKYLHKFFGTNFYEKFRCFFIKRLYIKRIES